MQLINIIETFEREFSYSVVDIETGEEILKHSLRNLIGKPSRQCPVIKISYNPLSNPQFVFYIKKEETSPYKRTSLYEFISLLNSDVKIYTDGENILHPDNLIKNIKICSDGALYINTKDATTTIKKL